MESDEEDATPPIAEIAPNSPEAMEVEPVPPPAENDVTPPSPTTTERPEPKADTREDQPRGSVFTRLGNEQPRRPQTSDGYQDLRNCPSRGVLFEHFRPVTVDRAVGPGGDRSFNCWARGMRGSSIANHVGSSALIAAGGTSPCAPVPGARTSHLSYLRGRDQTSSRGQSGGSWPLPPTGNTATTKAGPSSGTIASGALATTEPRSVAPGKPWQQQDHPW